MMANRSLMSLPLALPILALMLNSPIANAALVAHYTGDGTADDAAGTNDGTLEAGAGFRTGQIGQAFDFSGTGQYVSAPDSSLWDFGSNDFTIALWANFDTINQGAIGSLPNVFIGHDEGGGATNKWVLAYDGNGQLSFHVNGAGSAFIDAPASINPMTGEWNHYALARSGNDYEFFFNGVSLGTASNAISIPDATAPLTLGQAENLGFYDGGLDDVRIYDNRLTDGEIANLAAVPEPSSLVLMGMGLLSLAGYRSRKNPPAAV